MTGQRSAHATDKNISEAFSLTEGTGDDVHLVHDSVSVPDPSSSGPVQTHGVHFVHKGQSAKLVGSVTHFFQRAHGPCGEHGVGSLDYSYFYDINNKNYVFVVFINEMQGCGDSHSSRSS